MRELANVGSSCLFAENFGLLPIRKILALNNHMGQSFQRGRFKSRDVKPPHVTTRSLT